MKKRLIPFVLFVAVLAGCGSKKDPNLKYFQKADEYDDYIRTEQATVVEAFDAVYEALIFSGQAEVDDALKSLKKKASDAAEKMSRLAAYNNNTEYRDKAKAYFEYCVTVSDNELKEQMDVFLKGSGTEEEDARYDELGKTINTKLGKLEEDLETAQDDFVSQFHI
jgi:hypothetical protein